MSVELPGGTIQYMLRMPPELRDRLKSVAKENKRTMKDEILSRLESSFERAAGIGPTVPVEEVGQFVDMMLFRMHPVVVSVEIPVSDLDTIPEEDRKYLARQVSAKSQMDELEKLGDFKEVDTSFRNDTDIKGEKIYRIVDISLGANDGKWNVMVDGRFRCEGIAALALRSAGNLDNFKIKADAERIFFSHIGKRLKKISSSSESPIELKVLNGDQIQWPSEILSMFHSRFKVTLLSKALQPAD
jgi:hypothetical protein